MNQALTTQTVRRAVLRQTLIHPVTLGGIGVGIAAAVAAGIGGGVVALGITVAALAIGLGSWLFNYFVRRLEYVRRHVEGVNAERERARMQALGRIRATLFDLAQNGGGAELAARGLEQFQRIHVEHDTFGELLAKKLNVGELTYTRYVNAVDHAYQTIIDNLSSLVDRLRMVNDIDVGALLRRIERLEIGGPESADKLADLRSRLALWDARAAEIEALLGENDAAITALLRTSAAVAGMRDLDRSEGPGLDLIVGDLERLAERASPDYS